MEALVEAKFLFRTPDGAFIRVEAARPLAASPKRASGVVAA
jgi:hypothetical protein